MSARKSEFAPASSAGMTPAPASGAPSRESFFALYWDHARSVARFSICTLAGFLSAEIPELLNHDWDDLMTWERDKLRAAVLAFLPIHDATRAEAKRSRELRGEKVQA